MILSFIFLGEKYNYISLLAMITMFIGTFMMIGKQKVETKENGRNLWFIYALLSAVFASLTAILGKKGVENIDSNLATAIRTIFVFISAWFVVYIRKANINLKNIARKSWIFLILSGIAMGLS
nr:EamA family transporter [Miniphocaeibacter halophilus]